jgi:hypothetical protein
VEVVRRECDLRCELLDQAVAAAHSATDVVDALVGSFEHFLGDFPGSFRAARRRRRRGGSSGDPHRRGSAAPSRTAP